jgi:antitoxin ChpS
MTTATLRSLGGSIVLAIPPSLLDSLHLKAGSTVDIRLENNCLTLKPARKRYTLDELLVGLTESDTLPMDREFESIQPLGCEVL